MSVQAVERAADAFQQPVSFPEIEAMCRRAFGPGVEVSQAIEIGVGTYNTTYRVEFFGRDPVILRVAPARERQQGAALDVMRNEFAAMPFFATLGPLVPRILGADFTHQIVGRDYMVQSLLAGVPANSGLDAYPRPTWRSYYQQLGTITRAIHDVVGESFGPVMNPSFARWSEMLADEFAVRAGDFDEAGLDSSEVHRIVDAIGSHRAALDDGCEPRLLHGDLWRPNILIDPDAAEPTIVGVLDYDSASWGDPMADWTIHQVRKQAGTEADAFWKTYGPVPTDPGSAVRELFYRARNRVGARLDIHRRGLDLDEIPPIHWDLTDVLTELTCSA